MAGWQQQAQLSPRGSFDGDLFGRSVALESDLAVIGAESAKRDRPGAVYVFARAGRTWAQVAKLVPGDGLMEFGNFIAVADATVLVGEPDASISGKALKCGAVYAFANPRWDTTKEL